MLKTNVNQSDINELTIAELRSNSPFANTALPTETEAQAAFFLLSSLLREAHFVAPPGGINPLNIQAFNSSSVWNDDDSFAVFAQKQKVKEFITRATKIEETTLSEQDVLFFCFKLIRPVVDLLSTQLLTQTATQSAPTAAAIEIQLHEKVAQLSDTQIKKNLTIDPGYLSFIAEIQACYYQALTKVASEQINLISGETTVAAWWRYHHPNQTLPTAHQTLLPDLNALFDFIHHGICDKDSDYHRYEFVLFMLQFHGDKIRRFARYLASSQLFEPYLGQIATKDAWQIVKKIATRFLTQNAVSWSLPENSRQQKALVVAETLLDSSLFDRNNDDDINVAYQAATFLTRKAECEVFESPAIISWEEQENAHATVRNESPTPPALRSEIISELTALSGATTKGALIRYLGKVLLKNKLCKKGKLSLHKIFAIVTDLPAFYQLAKNCADQINSAESEETTLPTNDIGRLEQALNPVNPECFAGEIKAIGLAAITDYLYPPHEYKTGYIANFNLYSGALGNDTFTNITDNLAIRLSIYLKIPLSNTTRAESLLALALLANRYAPELLVRDIPPQQTYGFEMTSVDFRHGVTMAERVQPGSSSAYSFNTLCELATNDDMEWATDEQKIAVTSARLAPLLQHAMSRRLIPESDLDKVTAANQQLAIDYEINRKTQEAKDLEALMAPPPDRKVIASAQLKQYHPHINIDEKVSVRKTLGAGTLEMTRLEQYMTYSGKFYYNHQDLGFHRGQAMSAEMLEHDFNEDYYFFEKEYKAALISRLSWALKDLLRIDQHRLLGITAKNLKLVQVDFSNDKDEKEKGYRAAIIKGEENGKRFAYQVLPLAGGIKSLTLEPGKIPVTLIMIDQEISPALHGLIPPKKLAYDDGLYVNEKVDVNAYGVEVKNNNKKQQVPQQAESFDFPSFITTDTDNDKIEKLATHMVDNIFGLPVTDARRYYRRDTPKEKHDAAANLRSDVSKRLFIPFYSTAKDYRDGKLTFLGVIFGLLELASFLLPFGLAAKAGMRAAVVANKITVTSKTLTTLKAILAAKKTSKTLFWGLLDAANPFGFLVPLYQGGKKITLGLYKGYRWMHDKLTLLPCLAQLKKLQNLPLQTLNKTSSYTDYLDRLYPPATMLLKPTVINTVKKIRTVPDMTVAKAEELIEKTFRYSGDLENTSIKMEIIGYLDNAAQNSPTFRRLLQRHKFSGSAPIHVNFSSTYSQPRAYPDPKTLSRDYFNQPSTEDFTQLWNKHKTHTIEIPSAEKISQLKYFSYDGEHEFTLVQAMMHETVHMLTGLKDINRVTAINGVSIAGRGVGPVDHLTDIILAEMGKKIPLRVVYATEEFKQAYTAGAVRTQALQTAFEQTLAERRAINKQLKEILAQSDTQTVIERTKIDKRRTVAETLFFIKDLNAIRDAIERLSAQETANAFNGLVKWEFDAALDPALHARYQQNFQRLLTQSEVIKKDALLWWHKKDCDAQGTAWSLRVEPAVITATATPLALEVKADEKKIIVHHSDNWVYLSDQGIKPLETIRLAALALQKMFIQPFKNQLPTMLSSDVPPISAKDRGYEVVRAQAALIDIGYSALPTQISHLIANKDNQNEENYDEDDENNNITIKKLLQIQHQATLAAWKEDHFLAKPS